VGADRREFLLPSPRFRLLPLGCACFLAAVLSAQTPAGQQQIPVLKATARTVIVDVVVTNNSGDAVAGLPKQYFQVMEDGKPQTVNYFEEHGVKTVSPEGSKPLANLPPEFHTNVPPAPETDSVNVLLIDTLNTETKDQPFVRKQILSYLRQMKPGTRVAIFSLGSHFRFVQGFTSDVSRLQAALSDTRNGPETEKDASFHSRSDRDDDAAELRNVQAIAAELRGAPALVEGLAAAQEEVMTTQYQVRVEKTLDALESIARYLSNVPGRKNLIWLGGSFPVTVFPNDAERRQMSNLHLSLSTAKEMADLLFTSKLAVYPINAEGLANNTTMDAEHCLPERGNSCPDAGTGPALGTNLNMENDARGHTQLTMEKLADDTGGKAFYNTNDLSMAVQKAIANGSHYYTIAYTPTNSRLDGGYRKVTVKLESGNYKLAYRQGYNAEETHITAGKPAGDPLKSQLEFGLPNSTELLYGVRVTAAEPQPRPNAPRAGLNAKLSCPCTRYRIEYRIPGSDVAFVPDQNGRQSGKIDFGLVAYGHDGKAVNWQQSTLAMALKPDMFAYVQKNGIPLRFEIDLPNSDLYLETGLYDWGTGKTGTLSIPVQPGNGASSARIGPSNGVGH